jgi:hypothetical protein
MVTKLEEKNPVAIDRLEQLGFKAASGKLKLLAIRKRKMAIAYELYRYVTQDKIDAFNKKLKGNISWNYQMLDFQNIEHYEGAPPAEVLTELEKAQALKCFDSYEVGYILEVKDPLLFGRIEGCSDRFFLAQWDDDCKIEDILAPNEG